MPSCYTTKEFTGILSSDLHCPARRQRKLVQKGSGASLPARDSRDSGFESLREQTFNPPIADVRPSWTTVQLTSQSKWRVRVAMTSIALRHCRLVSFWQGHSNIRKMANLNTNRTVTDTQAQHIGPLDEVELEQRGL